MADPITWGLITRVKSILLGVKNTVESTEETVNTLPDKVDEKLDPVQEDMAQLITDVQNQVNEMREIIENSPAGVPAPWLESISSQSQEDGINVTYQAKFLQGRVNSTENWLFAQTKGVMVRYSPDGFPTNKSEGTLGFIDEDLFDVDENGTVTAKTKNNVIVGLTTNTKYYISAFPYSTNNVYNETLNQNNASIENLNNTTSCTWSGTKGTLTVNVSQDYDYKVFGEYTATMTPIAGGNATTKTQSGSGIIVFSGLEAGEYTLSFSAPAYFTAPQSQSVNITAGQSQTINVEYKISRSMNDYSWSEIDQLAKIGAATNIFAYGSKKSTTVAKVTGSAEDGYAVGGTESQDVIFIGANNHDPNTITFCTSEATANVSMSDMNKSPYKYSETSFCSFLESHYQQIFPEINQYIKTVSVRTTGVSGGYGEYNKRQKINDSFTAKIFPLPAKVNYKYPYFTDNSRYNLAGGEMWNGCYTYGENWGTGDPPYNIKFYNGYSKGSYREVGHNDWDLAVSSSAYFVPFIFCVG